jgi:ABC transporter substrate binding protein
MAPSWVDSKAPPLPRGGGLFCFISGAARPIAEARRFDANDPHRGTLPWQPSHGGLMPVTIGRRALIGALGGAAATWPLAARAQQPDRKRRMGVLTLSRETDPEYRAGIAQFVQATDDNLAERAAALVKAAPDAIVGGPAPPLRALQAATRSVPLVGMSEDMVGEGLVVSLARPGGNITGISLLSPELDGKRQDILIEAVPGARRIAAIADSRQTPHTTFRPCSTRHARAALSLESLRSTGRRRSPPRSMRQEYRVPRR